MGHAVKLHAVAVTVAILAGAEFLGATGTLLAVPVAAALSVVVREVQRERLALHRAGTQEQPPTAGNYPSP